MRRFALFVTVMAISCAVGLVLFLVASLGHDAGERTVAAWRRAIASAPTPGEARSERAVAAKPEMAPAEAASDTAKDDVRPVITREIVAAVGREVSLYFDGLVLVHDPDRYRFVVDDSGLGGRIGHRRWRLVPTAAQIGSHPLRIAVTDWTGSELATATTMLRVVATPPLTEPGNILITGSSGTHQSLFPNELWKLLDEWSPGKVRFIGTYHPKLNPEVPVFREALPGVFHEGYGGWTWEDFVTYYAVGTDKPHWIPRSPYVFLEDGRPTLDVARYLREQGVSGQLDAALFELGINETFFANPDDPESLAKSVQTTLDWAEKLLAAFRAAEPEARLVVMIPAPFTRSDAVFQRRYVSAGGAPALGSAWRHRQIVQALARAMVERLDGRSGITLVPVHAMFDTVDGLGADDPGHPNDEGGREIANQLFAVLADVFAQRHPMTARRLR
jgi:lysophospholipase L1-like esterase